MALPSLQHVSVTMLDHHIFTASANDCGACLLHQKGSGTSALCASRIITVYLTCLHATYSMCTARADPPCSFDLLLALYPSLLSASCLCISARRRGWFILSMHRVCHHYHRHFPLWVVDIRQGHSFELICHRIVIGVRSYDKSRHTYVLSNTQKDDYHVL